MVKEHNAQNVVQNGWALWSDEKKLTTVIVGQFSIEKRRLKIATVKSIVLFS